MTDKQISNTRTLSWTDADIHAYTHTQKYHHRVYPIPSLGTPPHLLAGKKNIHTKRKKKKKKKNKETPNINKNTKLLIRNLAPMKKKKKKNSLSKSRPSLTTCIHRTKEKGNIGLLVSLASSYISHSARRGKRGKREKKTEVYKNAKEEKLRNLPIFSQIPAISDTAQSLGRSTSRRTGLCGRPRRSRRVHAGSRGTMSLAAGV